MDAANLRRDTTDATVWRRAGKPRQVFSLGVMPFLRFSPYGDNREIELSIDGENNLYGRILQGCVGVDCPLSPKPQKLTKLAGEPILAVTSAPGIIRLLLRHAQDCFLTYSDDLQLGFEGELPALPEITLMAKEGVKYYAVTGNIQLTGGSSGQSGSKLCDADAQRVKAAMLGAYESLREQVRHNGCYLQPLTARYRLLDGAGNTIALGEKQLLACSDTIPTGKVLLTSSDGMQTLNEGSLGGRTYNPAIVVPEQLPYPWSRIVNKLVVEVTREMEPIDSSAVLPHGIQRNSSSGVSVVTAQLPGLEIEDFFTQARYDKLANDQLSAPMYKAYTFDLPFGGGITLNGEVLEPGTVVPLAAVNPTDYEEADSHDDGSTSRQRTYSAALDAGEFTILCNPKDANGGYYPGVAEIVRTEDLGEVISRRRVMEHEIVKVAPLPRSGSGWDFSRLKLLMFGTNGIMMATLNGKGEFHSVTTIDRRAVRNAGSVCEGTGEGGATLLAIAGGEIVELSGQKVTTLWTPGSLPRGRVGVQTLGSLHAIGWEGKHREIWLADTERLWRLTPSGRGKELIRAALPGIEGVDYQPPFRLGRAGGSLLLATSREQRNLSDEEGDGLMDVRLRVRGENPELTLRSQTAKKQQTTTAGFAPSLSGGLCAGSHPWLEVNVLGSGLMGSYTLRGDRGTEVPEELLRLTITGDVNAPIPVRVALPRRQWLEEEYIFAANEDLAIRNSQFVIHNNGI